MRHRFVAYAVALLVTTSRAVAQPAEPPPPILPEAAAEPVVEQPAEEPASPPPTQPQDTYDVAPQASAHHGTEKSPLLAGALSLGLTATGITLLVTAKDIAPHYDEKGSSDSWRISVVTSGVLLTLVGPTCGHIYAGQAWNPGLKWRLISGSVAAVTFVPAVLSAYGGSAGAASGLGLVFAASGVIYIGATVREIWTAPGAARRHNERREEGTSISIAPIIGREPGLAVAGRF